MLTALRRSRFGRRWKYGPRIIGYRLLGILLPVDPALILLLSDSREKIGGNLEFLEREIRAVSRSARVEARLRPSFTQRRSVVQSFQLLKDIARARVIVLDDYYPFIYPLRMRSGTSLIQVWHAAGAFKKVGYSREQNPNEAARHAITHRNYTYATVSSESIRGDYAEAFGIDPSRVRALGVPRTDAFFDDEAVSAARTAVRSRYQIDPAQKVVLFAPTFRGRSQTDAHYPKQWLDFAALAEELQGWRLLVKMHPFVRPPAGETLGQAVDVTGDREITELLMTADVLVTDYSSSIFEFALLHRPMVFFCPDLEEYRSARNFYYPLEDYLAGELVKTEDRLAQAVRSAQVTPKAEELLARFMSACDGRSSRRIVTTLIAPRDRT